MNQSDADGYPWDLPLGLPSWQRPITDRSSSYHSFDARLRADIGQDNKQVISMGYGTIRDGPAYLIGALGFRRAGAVHWGADLDLVGYRVPWRTTAVTIYADPENPNGILVSPPEYTDFRTWQVGLGLSVVIELKIL